LSVYHYDDGLLYKFKSAFKNTVLSPTDRAFQRCAEIPPKKGEVTFPLLSIYRENYTLQMAQFDMHSRMRGRKVKYENYAREVTMEKMIPLRIDYQLDLWSKNQRNVDKLLEEILFWVTNDPAVEVIAPIVKSEDTPDHLTSYIYYLTDKIAEEDVDYLEDNIEYEEQFEDYSVYSYYKFLNIITINDKIAYRWDVPDCIGVEEDEWVDSVEFVRDNMIDDLGNYNEIDWEDAVGVFNTEKIPTYRKTIVIDQDLQDNSDIMSFEDLGRIYRLTFPFYIDNARLIQHKDVKTVLDVDWEIILQD